MSFTSDVKQELCKLPLNKKCCTIAECYGFMLYANNFGIDKIKINSDSQYVRKRFFSIIKKIFPSLVLVDDA